VVRGTHPFLRLNAYYEAERAKQSGSRLNRTLERQEGRATVYKLRLKSGAEVQVGTEVGHARWFDLAVPGFGAVRMHPDTELISQIADKFERFMQKNNL